MRQLMDNETPQGVSDEWSTIPWRKLERYIFRLQKRIYQAKQRSDMRAVRGLKRVLKRSKAAKTLAVRQVTQEQRQTHGRHRRDKEPHACEAAGHGIQTHLRRQGLSRQ